MVTLASPETAKSIFTRLFFLKGHGLSHFKPFTYERSIIGNEIYVWKVDWEGKEKNIVYSLDQPAQDETAMNATESTADGNADNGTSSGSAADTTANSTEASAGLAGTVG
ncbi:hypothetical protein COY28_06400 [Candidatus Woesearchaeota archaeon CG_4_10_14_0_2_um_filter_57_5]|nr:MAG: hypothetical protein COY28_06400 [Candidatus Woesearchaeota archaeon CG_4_10_14_0_2_um_filter_57_5]